MDGNEITEFVRGLWHRFDLTCKLPLDVYIREAKIRPIKNQIYSPNTPINVREQMLAQLKTGFWGK